MNSFATVPDLELRWKLLEGEDVGRAAARLAQASRLVRSQVPTVDDRIASGELDPLLVADVVCDMVQRAMSAPIMGAESVSHQIGSVSQQVTYDNPMGNLFITAIELRQLSPLNSSAGFSINLFRS